MIVDQSDSNNENVVEQAQQVAQEQESSSAQQETQKLEKELAACLLAQQDWKDKYVRLNADFDNFKRRSIKDQAQWVDTASMKLLHDLVTIIDDFDRAYEQAHKEGQSETFQNWLNGFMLIRAALTKLLKKNHVEEMVVGTHFNPEFHEAVMQVSSAEHASGDIVGVLQKGYRYKDMILRPAKVSIAQ